MFETIGAQSPAPVWTPDPFWLTDDVIPQDLRSIKSYSLLLRHLRNQRIISSESEYHLNWYFSTNLFQVMNIQILKRKIKVTKYLLNLLKRTSYYVYKKRGT